MVAPAANLLHAIPARHLAAQPVNRLGSSQHSLAVSDTATDQVFDALGHHTYMLKTS